MVFSGDMSDDKDTIIEELRAELDKAKKREQEYAENRKAMLYMLEDLNESAQLIEKAKNEWEATFDAITDPLFIHDRDLNIIRANMAYMEYSGKSFQDIMGKPYYTIFPLMESPFESCLNAMKKEEEEEKKEEEITISYIKNSG